MSEHHRSKAWRAVVRKVRPMIAATLPRKCVDCQRLVLATERWQVGHIVDVGTAKALGWTREQIDDPSNLGPSHGPGSGSCNQRAGGKLGAAKTHGKRRADRRLPTW